MSKIKQAYISIGEAATYLGVTPTTIKRWGKDGRIPMYKLGDKMVRLKIEDLENFVRLMNPDEQTDESEEEE